LEYKHHVTLRQNPTRQEWVGTAIKLLPDPVVQGSCSVCVQAIEDAGETTSYYHQWHNLLRQGHEHPNPRKQILLDRKELVLLSIGQGYDVCISMDANEEWDSRNHQFSDWVEQCGLISAHEEYSLTSIITTITQSRAPMIGGGKQNRLHLMHTMLILMH
jgi:hypothetical protein